MAEHKKFLITTAIIVAAITVVIIGLCRLMLNPHTEKYEFLHSTDKIVKVEIIKNNDDSSIRQDSLPNDYTVLKEFSSEEQDIFIDEVYSLSCYNNWSLPCGSLNDFLIRITYENGDLEYLGCSCTAFYSNGKVTFTRKGFDNEFNKLLGKYVEQIY